MADLPIIFSAPMIRALLGGRKTQTRRILKGVPEKPEANCHPSHIARHAEPYLDAYCSEHKTEINPRGASRNWCWWQVDDRQCLPTFKVPCAAGDRLWVRETWQTGMGPNGPQITFRASPDYFDIDAWDGPDEGIGPSFNYDKCPGATWETNLDDLLSGAEGAWRSPIHMPRWASRLTLLVEEVKVERLQDISLQDVRAEGCEVRQMWIFGANAVERQKIGADVYRSLWESLHGEDAWTANPWVAAITFRTVKSNIDALPAPAAEQGK